MEERGFWDQMKSGDQPISNKAEIGDQQKGPQ
jgi:hypothetical protein